MKFYKCKTCTNIFEVIRDSNIIPVCCGKNMDILKANMIEGAGEKHLPVYKIKDNVLSVKIGETLHPFEPAHFIQWIEVITNKKIMRKMLSPYEEPVAEFVLSDGEIAEEIYSLCNLHGLWKV